MPSLEEFNLIAPETMENPYPFHRALREQAPVYKVPGLGFFVVSRYADIVHVLNHEDIFSSSPLVARPVPKEVEEIAANGYPRVNTLLTNDPPSHTRFRGLVSKAFSARRVAALEPSSRQISRELIDNFIAAGKVELISQFAVGLPLTLIADALGVSRQDLDKFKRWSRDSVAPFGGMITLERHIECAHSMVEFDNYFAAQIEDRRTSPRDDLMTDLINVRLEGTGALTVAELLSIFQTLLVAGNETTTNLIGSAMMLLIRNPDQMQLLLEDHSLIPNCVEEVLRMESPVQALFRVAKHDTEIAGVAIAKSSLVVIIYASGNRDDAQFPDPDRFDIRRPNARSHISFGQGIHFCMGAPLARLEGKVAFESLLTRLKNIRLAEGLNDFAHNPSFILRGLKALHLEFDPA